MWYPVRAGRGRVLSRYVVVNIEWRWDSRLV